MPSHSRQNKRRKGESDTPVRPPMQDIVYWMWESVKQTSLIVSEIQNEVRAINRASMCKSLKMILKRLSKLESDVNRFDLPHQEMVNNFDHFRQQLAGIQQEVMGSKSQPGQNPGFNGTLRSCLGDLGTQMGGFTDRMGNVEETLLKLEDLLFGRFDENVNTEAGYVMVKIHNELDFRQKLKPYTLIELTQMVQAQCGPWAKVDTVKLQEARGKGKFNYMIISFSDWDTGEHIRNHSANLESLFELDHGCSSLPFIHHLHIVDLAVHQRMGYDYDIKKFLEEELCEPGVRAKVAYQRLILQTESLKTARRLALTGVTVFNHHYQVKPYCAQGTPLFCNNCCNPGHFANDCNAEKPRCGLCAEAHESFTCKAQKDFKCCNCGGGHKAWDPSCTDKPSKAEHQKSLFYCNKTPHWALNLESTRSSNRTDRGNGKTKASTQGSSSVPSSQESTKRPVGRPRRQSEPNPAGQSMITSFMERKNGQESQDKEAEPDAMELTTPHNDLEMNGMEGLSSQPGSTSDDGSSNINRPSSSHDDIHDYGTLFGSEMSTTGGDEETEQSRPGSRLSESSSKHSFSDRSTEEAGDNEKHDKKGKKGKNGQNKNNRDNAKGRGNATPESKASSQRQKKDKTTPPSSQKLPSTAVRTPTGKGKAAAVEKDESHTIWVSDDRPRSQSRNKDIRGKRNKGDSNVSRDRGRSTNRTSSKVSSRRTNANNDSDNDSDSDSKTTDNGHAKSEGREKATNDKTQKSQQAGTPRHSNGTKSTPKVKASTRTPSVENTPSAALRTKSASRAPIGTPSNALLTTTPTSSTQHLNKRAGHSRPDSGREKAGPSFKPQGYKKRKLSQGSAKG
ncbi:hypothetical protein FOVG_08825 [Fusarium oxysporum f. sp. pisi HDV247]|uniref:CCHC-type domain-containing protein n=1 Tax=Fusarium oxysporum f. sp. pisi HDV247 TaxID=1080344 RepID=W9PC22_FUSOX|nr:hypothetical protein FOVG_08825 [Fusarium oxysporum f. sp. pisi HDV247]